MKKLFFLALLFTFGISAYAQDSLATKYTSSKKGKIFFYWGWNRARYSNSDIHFIGDQYNFTLHNTKAHDAPTGIHMDYINPLRLTIPQTNCRIGYFLSDKHALSIGFDHMKYVMNYNQTVRISGYNDIPGYEITSNTKKMDPTYIEYEHTDGLNYINLEIERYDDITPGFITYTDIIQLNTLIGIGGGILFPRTNVKMMGFQRSDYFHVSGFGLGAKVGLNLTIYKNFFIQTEFKGGYIDMPDVRTTNNSADKASQSFFFAQQNFVIGGVYQFKKRSRTPADTKI